MHFNSSNNFLGYDKSRVLPNDHVCTYIYDKNKNESNGVIKYCGSWFVEVCCVHPGDHPDTIATVIPSIPSPNFISASTINAITPCFPSTTNLSNNQAVLTNLLIVTPLNTIQGDTLLHQFPQRTHLSQDADSFLNGIYNIINFALCCESSNTESDTAVCVLITAAKSTKNVTWFKGCWCASAAWRQGDIFQGHQKRLSLHIGKGYIHTSWVEMVGVSILRGVL